MESEVIDQEDGKGQSWEMIEKASTKPKVRNAGEIPTLHIGLSEGQGTHCWNELEWRL